MSTVQPSPPTRHTRSSRPPASWDCSAGATSGVVRLPLRLYWSDAHDCFDLDDEAERRLLYQIVLTEGTDEDVRAYLHQPTLLAIWDTLWLPVAVHGAWDAWVAARRHAPV